MLLRPCMRYSSRPAEPERYDDKVAESQPEGSTWSWEDPYVGPPEDGQPRMGSAPQAQPPARAAERDSR
jgi:hypothetical protein